MAADAAPFGARGGGMAPDQRALDPLTRWLVLALPAAFLAHDLGEVRGNAELNAVMAELSTRSPRLSRLALATQTTDRQMAVAVGALTAGCVAVSVRAARRPAPGPAMSDFAAATAVMGGHLAVHLAQSLFLRRRVPGLIGGLAVTVPYSALVLRRLRGRGYVDVTAAGRRATGAALALGPALVAVRLLARRVG